MVVLSTGWYRASVARRRTVHQALRTSLARVGSFQSGTLGR